MAVQRHRTLVLAEADTQHFNQTTLVIGLEIGMRFDLARQNSLSAF